MSRRPRPLHVMLAALAVAGVLKAGLALGPEFLPGAARLLEGLPDLSAQAQTATKTGEPKGEPEADSPLTAEATCPTPKEMLDAIALERELLESQKRQLAQRKSEIELAAEKLDIETARLTDLKESIDNLLASVEKSRATDVERLVNLYRNMKPKDAAGIMDELDLEVSVMVLANMTEREAAPIMAQMRPVRARAISKVILERSKLPGDQRLEGLKIR